MKTETTPLPLADLLVARREELGETQIDVCDRGGFGKANASRWESGVSPIADKLERIARGYVLPLEVVIESWQAQRAAKGTAP